MDNITYYQRLLLNNAKNYYKNDKAKESKEAINVETYLKKIKTKIENMEKIDIIMCLKK